MTDQKYSISSARLFTGVDLEKIVEEIHTWFVDAPSVRVVSISHTYEKGFYSVIVAYHVD